MKFIKSIIEELKKIEWLSKEDLLKYSIFVILTIVLLTTFIGILDVVFISVRDYVTTVF